MSADEVCAYCGLTLLFTQDGQQFRFTAHDDSFCKESARHHKMILESMIKTDRLEMVRVQESARWQARRSHELERALEEALDLYVKGFV